MMQAGSPGKSSNHQAALVTDNDEREGILFQYKGDTALTATGSITGKEYRFLSKGAVLKIDRRDAFHFIAIPNLVKIDK